MRYPNKYKENEQEALNNLGLTLEEVLNDSYRFTDSSEQQAISLARRANALIDSETINADAWHKLMDESREFGVDFFVGDLLPDEVQQFVATTMKRILSTIDGIQNTSSKLFAMMEGEEVTLDKYTFKNERQYYDKLYSIRNLAIHYLTLRESLDK